MLAGQIILKVFLQNAMRIEARKCLARNKATEQGYQLHTVCVCVCLKEQIHIYIKEIGIEK